MNTWLLAKAWSVLTLATILVPVAHAQDWPADPNSGGFVTLESYYRNGLGLNWNGAVYCVSVGSDGSVIGGDLLPVGRGRWLECQLPNSPAYRTAKIATGVNAWHCVLGQLSNVGTGGDERLYITITSQSPGAPWTLAATSRTGEAFTVHKLADQSNPIAVESAIWPVWVNGYYSVISHVPIASNGDCDRAFGL